MIQGVKKKTPSEPLTFEKKKKILKERFHRYWDLRSQGKYDQTWKFELPYYRFVSSFDEYKELLGTYYKTKVKLVSIKFIHPNIAIVTRRVITKDNSYDKKDKWIYVNGKWYHKFYQSIFPPSNPEEAEFQ